MVDAPSPGGQGLLDMNGVFTPDERERILARLNSLFAWVGARVPEIVELEGREVRLRRLLNKLINDPALDDEDLELARGLEKALVRKEQELKRQLREAELTEDEALLLFQEARGLLRAMLRLRELGREERNLEGARLRQKLDDEKRWVALLRSVGKLK